MDAREALVALNLVEGVGPVRGAPKIPACQMVIMRDHFAMSTSNISVGKAKPALCEIVEQAGAGRTRIITVHGKPIAQIGPVPAQTSNAKKLTEAWRKRVKHIRLNRPGQTKVSLHGLIAESRK